MKNRVLNQVQCLKKHLLHIYYFFLMTLVYIIMVEKSTSHPLDQFFSKIKKNHSFL